MIWMVLEAIAFNQLSAVGPTSSVASVRMCLAPLALFWIIKLIFPCKITETSLLRLVLTEENAIFGHANVSAKSEEGHWITCLFGELCGQYTLCYYEISEHGLQDTPRSPYESSEKSRS